MTEKQKITNFSVPEPKRKTLILTINEYCASKKFLTTCIGKASTALKNFPIKTAGAEPRRGRRSYPLLLQQGQNCSYQLHKKGKDEAIKAPPQRIKHVSA